MATAFDAALTEFFPSIFAVRYGSCVQGWGSSALGGKKDDL
jgi:hypothetical protein